MYWLVSQHTDKGSIGPRETLAAWAQYWKSLEALWPMVPEISPGTQGSCRPPVVGKPRWVRKTDSPMRKCSGRRIIQRNTGGRRQLGKSWGGWLPCIHTKPQITLTISPKTSAYAKQHVAQKPPILSSLCSSRTCHRYVTSVISIFAICKRQGPSYREGPSFLLRNRKRTRRLCVSPYTCPKPSATSHKLSCCHILPLKYNPHTLRLTLSKQTIQRLLDNPSCAAICPIWEHVQCPKKKWEMLIDYALSHLWYSYCFVFLKPRLDIFLCKEESNEIMFWTMSRIWFN